MKLKFAKLDPVLTVVLLLACVAVLALLYWLFGSSSLVISNTNPPSSRTLGALSGTPCDHANQRPIAVMLSSDAEARPLSAIGQADMVFEMPVTPNGITRMMAVYQCNQPSEFGSIRSARGDFIPLAQGLDAILVHWGGEKDALNALNNGVIDNIDALKYEGTTFFRKNGIARPHNGFTSSELLWERVETLGYRATSSIAPYLHQSVNGDRNLGSLTTTVEQAWPQGMNVRFTYDPTTNTYLRERGNKPEYDASTKSQVHTSVVIAMHTTATFLHDQYIHVQTLGSGVATIWQRGQRISALWKKGRPTDPLLFTDSKGTRIPLEPGTVWVLIDAPLPTP